MADEGASVVSIRALEGEPLRHQAIREMVVAAAHAVAERQGVRVLDMQADASSLTTHLAAGRIEALGFAAEVRRVTTSWYRHKFGVEHLWGEPRTGADPADPADP